MTQTTPASFSDFNLVSPLLKSIQEVGYETPSPIQAACIPAIMRGTDVIGQAQTGTGKTAAFALPFLNRIDTRQRHVQLLVLTPTRELAIQVAEAFQRYARHLKDFQVLPVYGGQSYGIQLRQLRRGAHVVVGTPGRIMDHIRRETLKLDKLDGLVLDEADEMLRMGFIDDVEWILARLPDKHQTALFSATMPPAIKKVAERYLHDPELIKIKAKTTTAATIRQRYWQAQGVHKLDALSRVLETEDTDGVIVFVRTRTATQELAEKLSARGHRAAALNGDIPQAAREKIVEQLRHGRLDILIATDVAARGLDVPRISHVVNYDIPYDTESYIHRIGRTGRAGRTGEAILFVAPRERRMLRTIEKATKEPIKPMDLPSVADVNLQREKRFKQRILDNLTDTKRLEPYYRLLNELESEHELNPMQIAAALATMAQGEQPLHLSPAESRRNSARDNSAKDSKYRSTGSDYNKTTDRDKTVRPSTKAMPLLDHPDIQMTRYRVAVGRRDGVKPANIVGAIANEAGIESQYIGSIDIYHDFSTVDLPTGMPKDIREQLKNAWVCQRQLAIREMSRAYKEETQRNGEHKTRKSRNDKTRKTKKTANKATRKKATRKKDTRRKRDKAPA